MTDPRPTFREALLTHRSACWDFDGEPEQEQALDAVEAHLIALYDEALRDRDAAFQNAARNAARGHEAEEAALTNAGKLRAARAEADALRAVLPDPQKLRLLADWLDIKYPADPRAEVQCELRRWADAIEALATPDRSTVNPYQPLYEALRECYAELSELRAQGRYDGLGTIGRAELALSLATPERSTP